MSAEAERQAVERLLRDVYTPEGVELWMRGRHRLLNNEAPADFFERGEGMRVLAVASQLAETAYA